MAFRKQCHIIWSGGRGSGKTHGMRLSAIAHCNELGADARALFVRESHSGLIEIFDDMYRLSKAAFGTAHRNKAAGTIELPNGAVMYFTNLGDEESYAKVQGRTVTGIFADEVGNYPPDTFRLLFRLRSNLRPPAGVRGEFHMTANPHGRAHSMVFKILSQSPPWRVFQDEHGAKWIWVHSTARDNPAVDFERYRTELLASTAGDEALADAWIEGKWSVLGGSIFDNFDPAVHLIDHLPPVEWGWRVVGADWGTRAPSAAHLVARPKGDYRFPNHPPGSLYVLDECCTCVPGNLEEGLGDSPASFAERVKEMLARNNIRTCQYAVIDDMRGLHGDTVVDLMNEQFTDGSLRWRKPIRKDRVGHAVLLRHLLDGAVTHDGPGIYFVSHRCEHLIETIPMAPRSPTRANEIDPRWRLAHHLDALFYGVRSIYNAYRTTSSQATVVGMY